MEFGHHTTILGRASTPEAVIALLQTADQRRRAAQAEAEAEEADRLQQEIGTLRGLVEMLLGSVHDVVFICGPTAEITEANAAFSRLTGRPAGSVKGLPVAQIFQPADRAAVASDVARALRGMPVEPSCRRISTADGGVDLRISLCGRPRESGVGAVMIGTLLRASAGACAVGSTDGLAEPSHPMAARHGLAEGAASELDARIRAAEGGAHGFRRLAEDVEHFLAAARSGSSADTLSGLGASLGLSTALPRLRKAIEAMTGHTAEARSILERARRIAVAEAEPREVFDLDPVVRAAVRWVRSARTADVTVRVAAEARVPTVGRPGQIQRVVMALLQNALYATEGRPDRELAVSVRSGSGGAVVEIGDTGPSVLPCREVCQRGRAVDTPADRHELEEYRPDGQVGVLGIITEHDGSLIIGSRPQGGGLTRLTLPAPPAT